MKNSNILTNFRAFPRPIRSTAINLVAARKYYLRYGSEYRSFRRFLSHSDDFSIDEREAWKLQRLISLVSNATENTEYYGAQAEVYTNALGARTLDDALRHLPPLRKEVLRSSPNALLSTAYRTVETSSTSGTTGSPMQVQHERGSIMRRFAFQHNHAERNGIQPFAPSIRLSGRLIARSSDPRPYLYNIFERQYFMSSYHLHERYAHAISDMLHRAQPTHIDGYPSAIAQLIELAASVRPLPTSLTHAITTAETLDPSTVERIRSPSGILVLDYYSASEGLPYIQQCVHGIYHVRWQSGILEVERGGEYFRSGDGALVCTSFVQDKMPLIRYSTGDWIEGLQPYQECACGLKTETVNSVLGRVEDLVITRDGRSLGMFSYRTLKTIKGLEETQIIQNDFDDFTVLSTRQGADDNQVVEDEIASHFSNALGYSVRVELRCVKSIPRGPNGKLRLVISNMRATSGTKA